jgi:hypothetical protein
MFLGRKVRPVRRADKITAICPHQAYNPNNYRRALMSAPSQAITPNPHTNLQNVYIQIASKIGFQQQKSKTKEICKPIV